MTLLLSAMVLAVSYAPSDMPQDIGSVVVPGEISTPAAPMGNPGNWITSDDYPSLSLRLEEEGIAEFRIYVGHDGRVSRCEITESSGSALLDEQTCAALIFRARFVPARDAQGNTVKGTYSSAVRWQIPGDSADNGELAHVANRPSDSTFSFYVDYSANGTIEDCRLIESTADNLMSTISEDMFCAEYRYSGYRIEPYTDENGMPVARRARVTFRTVVEEIPDRTGTE